jgi:hypothetical protein
METMEWKEYCKSARFKYLEMQALELSKRIDTILKTMEEECPLPKDHFYSISAGNKCVSRYMLVDDQT